MRYDAVLFDLDGTLTDPAEGICSSIQHALRMAGLPAIPNKQCYSWIGPSLLYSFMRHAQCSEVEAKRILTFYRERYSTVGLFENAVYPGIAELLSDLKAAGVKLAVATGKPTVYSKRILEHFELLQYFDFLSGTDLNYDPGNKHEVLAKALTNLALPHGASCVMVGDRFQDADSAKANGIPCIGVLYGYGDREELAAAGVILIAESVDSLRSLLLS